MDFDHVIEVLEDGTVRDAGIYGPESVHVCVDDEGYVMMPETFVGLEGWRLLTGFTGQYGYAGPIMHPSEYIGGGLERHILENPGYHVAVVVYDDSPDSEVVGWAVAYREKV